MKHKLAFLDNFWQKVGKEYCASKKYKYIVKNDEIDETRQMHESCVVVLAIDESGSMGGRKWRNAI